MIQIPEILMFYYLAIILFYLLIIGEMVSAGIWMLIFLMEKKLDTLIAFLGLLSKSF